MHQLETQAQTLAHTSTDLDCDDNDGPEAYPGYCTRARSLSSLITSPVLRFTCPNARTPVGQVIASIAMIIGYAIIAVPTGIVTVELDRATRRVSTQACPHCSKEGHEWDADHCKFCGEKL